MPIYEYKCDSCGEIFELIQKFSDTPLKVHENCGGALERLLSAAALQFKGSGWYVTDYAGKSNGKEKPAKEGKEAKEAKEAKKDGSSSNSATKSDSATKSESKPAASTSSDKSSSSDKSDKKV